MVSGVGICAWLTLPCAVALMATCKWNSYVTRARVSLVKISCRLAMISRDPCRDEAKIRCRGATHRFLGLFDAGFDLLKGCLELVVDLIDLVLANNGDGRLGGELLGARPAQAPVPSHSVGAGKRATTMGRRGAKWRLIERSDHAHSRRRIFVMKCNGRGKISTRQKGGNRGRRLG